MPNRRVGRNKRAGGKILKNNKRADLNKAVQRGIFLKINKRAGQIPIHLLYAINVYNHCEHTFVNSNKLSPSL